MNFGEPVKDRAGKWIILEAEKRGQLKAGRARGGIDRRQYRHRAGRGRQRPRLPHADPDSGNAEPKKDMLRLCGANSPRADAALFQSEQYQHVGRRRAAQLRKKEPNGVLFADQWNN